MFLAAAGGAAGGSSMIIMLILIFVIFYFFMIRPENKRKKKLEEMRSELTVGDEIVTIGGIIGKVVEVNIGPTVTQYELSLSSGTRVSKIVTINKEIALALAKKDVRIQAPIPGKSTVGIEMPNEKAQPVTIRETLELMPSSLDKKPQKKEIPTMKVDFYFFALNY